ncbi:MAG TPA: TetR/AcrR family transcriptional regulator [Deltaproteobacteria bacterium]|jgi:TetR/AcrR family fatty acid metabolism transcriptional regulator|nr:TetR/AcrR family transcriptional regulator [Deltaproteobacteria bacterium]
MARGKPKVGKREMILDAALKVFAQKGFQDATISEISKAAGVADATVYEYFKSKEDLLFSIPERITRESTEVTARVLSFVRTAEAKLRVIVQNYIETYEKNPEYASLIMLHLKASRNFLKTSAYEVVRTAAKDLLASIREGIENGEFKPDTDPFLVRATLLGAIEHLATRKHLLGTPANLMEYIDPLLDMILEGIRVRKEGKAITIHLHLSGDELVPETNPKKGKKG